MGVRVERNPGQSKTIKALIEMMSAFAIFRAMK